ncbi:type IV pilus assembly protein PilM [Patescibacteria group bacterium]|nr:type IV pilus assembly protein PilM [Patescibacteria group bacterium]
MSEIVGVDVGIGSIKVISLKKEGEKVFLESIGETRTPQVDWLKGDNKGKSIARVAVALKSLLSDLKIRPKKVVSCLPEDQVVSRLIRLPPLKESEIKDALKFEAETFVPYPLSEVTIDYEVVEEDEAGRLTIFVIAARNEVVASYMKLFKSVGLELLALESPAVAMRRAVLNSIKGETNVMVVDMGEKYSGVVSLNKKKIIFTRSLSVGGESLTRAISINLGLDMASAEEYKKAYGLKESELEGKIRSAILPIYSSLAEELRKALVLFNSETGENVGLLALSGGGAVLPGLAEELTRLLGLEVQVLQPFLRIDTNRLQLPIDLNSEGCRFTLALGLALRRLE